MRDLLLNESGDDLVLTPDAQWVDGNDQVIQSAKIILKTPLGDFSLDPNLGLERVNLLAKTIIPDYASRDIKEALIRNSQQIADVENIIFNQEKATRNLTVAFDLRLANNSTITGGTAINA